MAERRSLTEGLKATPEPVPTREEKQFVYGTASATPANATAPKTRLTVSTRLRSDYATALKRASLERQLEGVEPNTLQDILEEALEPWLRGHGYLP